MKDFLSIRMRHKTKYSRKQTLTARNIRAGIVVHPAQLNRINCEASYSVMNKQQMRIANIRLTMFCERNTGLFHLVRERAFFMKNTCGSGQNELGRILC